MKAMVLNHTARIDKEPLCLENREISEPATGQIRLKILACGVCHTELDEIEGRQPSRIPVIPGHEVIGLVDAIGPDAGRFEIGQRVGVGWINSACGKCDFCRSGAENLCEEFQGTGCDVDGGYAQYMLAYPRFAYPIPDRFSDSQAAPLLCAGAIGYRALKLTNMENGMILGLFGFGASAHIVIQIVKHKYPDSRVFVFTRPGQKEHQQLAGELGANWAGATGEKPPEPLNAAIDFTPAWQPVVHAMSVLQKGGRLVINAIRKENADKKALLELDYSTHLWSEKELKTVANITSTDVGEFLPLAAQIPITPKVQEFKLEQANKALKMLKKGEVNGAAVLKNG